MATFQKLYFRNQAASATGITLPSTAGVLDTSRFTAGSGSDFTNRDANTAIGAGQTSGVVTTSAGTSADSIPIKRFLSPRLAAGTYTNLNFTHSGARAESNLNSNFQCVIFAGLWDGTTYTEWNGGAAWAENTSAATQQAASLAQTGLTLTVPEGGPLLVFEMGRSTLAQSMGTAYTNTYYYDGTTEASATNCATFVNFDAALTIFTPAPDQPYVNLAYPQLLAQ